MTYALECPACGHDARWHDTMEDDNRELGCRNCPCERTDASLFEAECARLASLAVEARQHAHSRHSGECNIAVCDCHIPVEARVSQEDIAYLDETWRRPMAPVGDSTFRETKARIIRALTPPAPESGNNG